MKLLLNQHVVHMNLNCNLFKIKTIIANILTFWIFDKLDEVVKSRKTSHSREGGNPDELPKLIEKLPRICLSPWNGDYFSIMAFHYR